MSCQKCGSARVLNLQCKHDDRFSCSVGEFAIDCDYAPRIQGLCGGDYTNFDVCLDCGQMQGDFPKDEVEGLEDQEPDEPEYDRMQLEEDEEQSFRRR